MLHLIHLKSTAVIDTPFVTPRELQCHQQSVGAKIHCGVNNKSPAEWSVCRTK